MARPLPLTPPARVIPAQGRRARTRSFTDAVSACPETPCARMHPRPGAWHRKQGSPQAPRARMRPPRAADLAAAWTRSH